MTFADVVASLHSPRPGRIACIVRNAGIARIACNDRNNCNDEETSNDGTAYSVPRNRHPCTAFHDSPLSFQNNIPKWDTPSGTFSIRRALDGQATSWPGWTGKFIHQLEEPLTGPK